MLTKSLQDYFFYLTYNSNVEHDLSFSNQENFNSDKVALNWNENITNAIRAEVYVQSSLDNIFIADPFTFVNDNSLLVNDLVQHSNYIFNQVLVGSKPYTLTTDISKGDINLKKINILNSYKTELDRDRVKNLNQGYPYIDPDFNFINRYLNINGVYTWSKTSIKPTKVSSNFVRIKNLPVGKSIVSLLSGQDNPIAVLYKPNVNEGYLVSKELSLNMQDTNPYDISLSLLACIVLKDYKALTNLLLGLVTLSEISDSNCLYQSYDRITLKNLSKTIDIRDNAILLWVLSLVINTVQDLPFTQRLDLSGYELHNRIKQCINKIAIGLINSYDPVEGSCYRILQNGLDYENRNNLETSFWVSAALSKSLNIVFNEKVHEVAARLYLDLEQIQDLNYGPGLNRYTYNSWSEVREAKYIWKSEFSLLGDEVTESFNESEYIGNLILNSSYNSILSEEIKIKVQTDLYFREVVFLNLVNKAFKYINKKTFKLLAIETKAFVSYLEQWSKYSWPSGYKWNYNNKATTVGTVLHSLLNSNTETTFSYCLKLKRLENSISLSNSTGEYLESYTEVFRYRQLESDTYWQQFLQKLVEFITTDSSKITDTYLSHIGCKSVFNKNLIDTWSDFKEYNWFSSPEQTNFINKEANPNNLQQEDYYYLVYYPKQRFLDSKTKLDNRPILKTDFIKRPVPGFTYYLDCSEDINLAEDLDITVDSNYYIDPLRKYTGQITINVSAAPDCLIKALSLNTIAGVKKNIIYSSVYKIN